jgi:hypothetical protein
MCSCMVRWMKRGEATGWKLIGFLGDDGRLPLPYGWDGDPGRPARVERP